MNIRDALHAGPEHGVDRLPNDVDRRLRRRLGLESQASTATRRAWHRPAIGAFALAAIAVIVFVLTRTERDSGSLHHAATAFVDVSRARWLGTASADAIEVRAESPASATLSWHDRILVAAPGTRVTSTGAGNLVLAHGALQIEDAHASPLFVDVPVGRVVIAASHARIETKGPTLSVLIDNGTGHFIDADAHSHPLVAGTPLVWPPPAPVPAPIDEITHDGSAAVTPPARKPAGRASAAPGLTPPQPAATETQVFEPSQSTPPPVTDVPCTFKSDCDPGATCRNNEHGQPVCMGHGAEGAACWFDNDCVSGRCAKRRCAR